MAKESHASHESISLNQNIRMKHGCLHFKAEKGYQAGMVFSFEEFIWVTSELILIF